MKAYLKEIEEALQNLMHYESAAVAPQTNQFIEDGRMALAKIQEIREANRIAQVKFTYESATEEQAKILNDICSEE